MVGDKSNIKNSVIGDQCVVGVKVKLTNSVVMDHVNIEQGQVSTLVSAASHTDLTYTTDPSNGLVLFGHTVSHKTCT